MSPLSMLFTNVPKFEELDAQAKVAYHEDRVRYEAVAVKGGHGLAYARAGTQHETWVPLIEKAYAKLYSNFAHLDGGFTREAMEDLTGCVHRSLEHYCGTPFDARATPSAESP